MTKSSKLTPFTLFVSIIASLGGILFGYNTSVISGALLFISKDFLLSNFDQALIVSILLIGALIGAFVGGYFADIIGRKKTMLFSIILFVIGTVIMIVSNRLSEFMVGRFVLGLGVGIVSVTVPLYIAEMSPPSIRGALVSFNQFAITIGILLGYIIDYLYSGSGNWQAMFAFAFVPTIVYFVALFFIPETPSFLSKKGKKGLAKQITHHILGRRAAEKESLEGKEERIRKKPPPITSFFKKPIRSAFITGIGISIFQQITGINVIIYYAPRIFQLAGFTSEPAAILATMGIGIVNVFVTLIALLIIDKVGRKPLLIIGLIGMAISLFTLGICFFEHLKDIGVISVISLMAYVSFFAISLGPIAWLLISEIFPLSIRGKAMGIAIFANWICNYIVSLTFLNLIEDISLPGAFWLYTGICLVALWFVSAKVPETKSKTFEQIQKFWK